MPVYDVRPEVKPTIDDLLRWEEAEDQIYETLKVLPEDVQQAYSEQLKAFGTRIEEVRKKVEIRA
jgi:hypothetical protein